MASRVALFASLLTCSLARTRLRNATSQGVVVLPPLAYQPRSAGGSELAVLGARGGFGNSTTVHRSAPCHCEANNPAWVAETRTTPKCIFIDLGAADGNSFQQFLGGKYGPLQNCPSEQWEAFLVEANPQFTHALSAVAGQYPYQVHSFSSTAAYSCEGTTSFSIDPDAAHNHWGSSMKRQFGGTVATVPTMNVVELIATKVTQADWVMLKVDIEGAEYDLIPCLAQFTHAGLVDRMYLEEHSYLQGDSVYTYGQYQQAKQHLLALGVDIPAYHSQTL